MRQDITPPRAGEGPLSPATYQAAAPQRTAPIASEPSYHAPGSNLGSVSEVGPPASQGAANRLTGTRVTLDPGPPMKGERAIVSEPSPRGGDASLHAELSEHLPKGSALTEHRLPPQSAHGSPPPEHAHVVTGKTDAEMAPRAVWARDKGSSDRFV